MMDRCQTLLSISTCAATEREKIVNNYINGVGNTGPADPRLFDAGDVGGGRGWGGVGQAGGSLRQAFVRRRLSSSSSARLHEHSP